MADEQVFVYNRGKRTWDIPVAWEEDQPKAFVQIGPGQSKELPKEVAEKFVKRYGRELMFGQGDTQRRVDPRLAELEEENERLRARITEIEKPRSSDDEGSTTDEGPTEKDLLILEAQRIGLEFDKRIGVDKLKKLIEEAGSEDG